MKTFLAYKCFRSNCLLSSLAILLLASLVAGAQEKPKPKVAPAKPAPAAAAPAAKAPAPPVRSEPAPSRGTTTATPPAGRGTGTGSAPEGRGTTTGTTPTGRGTSSGAAPSGNGTTTGTEPTGRGTTTGTAPGSYGTTPTGRGTTTGTAPGSYGTTPTGRGNNPGTTPVGRGNNPGTAPGSYGTAPAGRGNNPGGGMTFGRGASNTGAPAGRGASTSITGRPAPRNYSVARSPSGNAVSRRPNGRPADVHVANRGGRQMDVHHGLNGNRRAVVERPDHSHVMAERGGRGYVERSYSYHGREYAHRTYYYNGRAYDRFYSPYRYHGMMVSMYTPSVYYAPAFYGWAYSPWATPVRYSWGWAGTPWFGFYGSYFTPYPVYPSASLWLTDYLIANSLQASYAAQQQSQADAAAAAQANAQVALSPQTKDLIAEEVKRQIALEDYQAQTAAQNAPPDPNDGIQRMMNDNIPHVFVVGQDLDVVDDSGAECALGQGDALQLAGRPGPNDTAATLVVLASKGGLECRASSTVSVSVADLQDMQNYMRETIAQGMGDMQANAGKGLPNLPAPAAAPPTKAAFAADPSAPGPEANVAAEINQETKEADMAEQAALQDTPAPAGGPSATPATVTLGMTIDQVTAILGPPLQPLDAGTRQIYMYKNLKITFQDGKVTDIQ